MTHRVVAPSELVETDFQAIKYKLDFRHNSLMTDVLMASSVLGHSQKGHAEFRGKKFKDTTIIDVLKALRIEKIRDCVGAYISHTSKTIDELLKIATKQIAKEDSTLYSNVHSALLAFDSRKEPFFDSNQYLPENYTIDSPLSFLRGCYIASQMDSLERRLEVMKRYPQTLKGRMNIIGGGKCHVANLRVIDNNPRISLSALSEKECGLKKIEQLYKEGILIEINSEEDLSKSSEPENLFNLYVREKIGQGTCDDATSLYASIFCKKYYEDNPLDVLMGMFLFDQIDTFDKVTNNLVTGGNDEKLGDRLNIDYKTITGEDLVNEDLLYFTIFMGSKSNGFWHSSSIRYFSQKQKVKSIKKTAYDLYFDYLNASMRYKILLGYPQVRSNAFLNRVESNFNLAKKGGYLKEIFN